MQNFKIILTLFTFLSFFQYAHAQDGFKVIRKAQRKYDIGLNKKALKLLEKADNMDYGFCGNAWMDANREINTLRATIYIDQKQYQLARNSLDSIFWEYPNDNFDSIRIRTYQFEFGKDSLAQLFDSSLDDVKIECSEFACFFDFPLRNGQTMRLKLSSVNNFELFSEEKDDEERLQKWLERFRASENYKMINVIF